MINEAEKNDGEVSLSYKEIAKAVGASNLSTVRNHLIRLATIGEIIIEQSPKRGTRNALYRVSNTTKSKDMDISSEFIQIQFEEITVTLRKTKLVFV